MIRTFLVSVRPTSSLRSLFVDPDVDAVWHLLHCSLSAREFDLLLLFLSVKDDLEIVVWLWSMHNFIDSTGLSIDLVDCFGGRVVNVAGDCSLSDVHTLLMDQIDE